MSKHSGNMASIEQPLALLQSYIDDYQNKQLLPETQIKKSADHFAFTAAGRSFIVRMNQVAEVVKTMPQITALPFSPPWLLGLGSLRGDVFSVVDFKAFLSNELIGKTKSQSNIAYVVFTNEAEGYVFKVEAILGIRSCEVIPWQFEHQWLDGKAELDGHEYFKINLQQLMADASFIQGMY